jgi:hypothetical protein
MTAPLGSPAVATDVDGVLAALRTVVDRAEASGDRIGLFAALYRQVTLAVAKGITDGVFDDGPRLNRLDTTFANRYLSALAACSPTGTPGAAPRCWQLAFEAAERPGPVIVQHLILGVNAHINLDLAVAAAQTCPGPAITDLKGDFDRINGILASVMGRLQHTVERFSPVLAGLDVVLGRLDDTIIGFSLETARSEAWDAAVLLAGQLPEAQAATERMLDRYATGLARAVLSPPWPLPQALEVVRSTERTPVRQVIAALDAANGVTDG